MIKREVKQTFRFPLERRNAAPNVAENLVLQLSQAGTQGIKQLSV